MLLATVLALGSAALHAGWNLLVKVSEDRAVAAWGQFLFAGLLALPVLVVIGLPESETYPYLLASSVVHVAYIAGLVLAYTHGDFSFAYPLARGGGALLAALGGVALLGDHLGVPSWVAILVIAGALGSLVRPGTSLVSIGWAVFTAGTIAAYTLIDAAGVRAVEGTGREGIEIGVRYGFALMPLTAVTLSVSNIAQGNGAAFLAGIGRHWRRYLLAGAMLTTAYTMVLVAIRQPDVAVGYVTMLRESSIIMGALAGWLFLHERLGRPRLVSSMVVVAGMAGLVALNVGT